MTKSEAFRAGLWWAPPPDGPAFASESAWVSWIDWRGGWKAKVVP